MAYPDDKETWERVETNDIIVKAHTNNWEDFIERLQDILGYGIRLGYGSVRFLLDYLKAEADKVVEKVDKSGGFLNGNFQFTQQDAFLRTKTNGYFTLRDDNSPTTIKFGDKSLKFYCAGADRIRATNEELQILTKMSVRYGDLEFKESSEGIILLSPNQTQYRILVDNAGDLVVEEV